VVGRSAPTFADLDGDGDLDAVVGASDGKLHYYENTGTAVNPLFAAPVANAPFGLSDVGTYSMPTFADLNADGRLDAIVGDYNGDLFLFQGGRFLFLPLALKNP
jgi:hypothetical protein